MKLKLLLGCSLVAMLSSCSTISHTSQSASVDTEVYNLTVADMNVSPKKASTTIDWKWTPFSAVSLETQKENATAELTKSTGSDVVVEPQYTVVRRGLFRGGSITVTGYPATYSNFRTMTKEDAEAIAALDGKIAVVSPMIGTSSNRTAKKSSSKFGATTIDNSPRQFLNFVGGMLVNTTREFETPMQFGLMYGRYGKKWGWYAKAMYMTAQHNSDAVHGGQLTIGAIKTLSRNWNTYLGVGIGTAFAYDYKYDGYRGSSKWILDSYVGMPVEWGIQWVAGKFNVTAGANAMFNFDGGTEGCCHINPFVGIGYSF